MKEIAEQGFPKKNLKKVNFVKISIFYDFDWENSRDKKVGWRSKLPGYYLEPYTTLICKKSLNM